MADLLAALVLAAGVAGCASQAVELGSGTFSGGDWSAWTWHDGMGEGVCAELRALNRPPLRLCGLQAGVTGIARPDAVPGEDGFLLGELGPRQAVRTRVTLADGAVVQADAMAASSVSDVRFFVVVLPAGSIAATLDLLDANGGVVESQPIGP